VTGHWCCDWALVLLLGTGAVTGHWCCDWAIPPCG